MNATTDAQQNATDIALAEAKKKVESSKEKAGLELVTVYLNGFQDGLERARQIYNNVLYCPNCLKEYKDEPNKLSIEKTGECLSCDHIATD